MTKTHKYRTAHAIRKSARRRICGLFHAQNGLCHWCMRPCLLKDARHRHADNYATVDHVKPLSDSRVDANRPGNLVMSCQKCNSVRSNTAGPPKFKTRSKVCPKCGGVKNGWRTKCLSCHDTICDDFLILHGWVLISKSWQCPATGICYPRPTALKLAAEQKGL